LTHGKGSKRFYSIRYDEQQKKEAIMTSRNLLFTSGLLLGIFIIAFAVGEGTTNSQECLIVRITGGQGNRIDTIALEPDTMTMKKGDCVVWVNLSPAPDVMIKFEEGKKCVEATDAPTGFNPEFVQECYVTGMIRKGATSSLRFIEPGTYEYSVATTQLNVVAKGKIVVQ